MHSWTILAAKHAALTPGVALGALPAAGWDSLDGVAVGMLLTGVGYAAMSARRARSCPLPPAIGQLALAEGENPPARRVSRFRQRVDTMLTGMLSDDADKLSQAAGGKDRRRSAAEPRFDGPSSWRGDYVDALPVRREPGSHPYPDVPASSSQAPRPAGSQAPQADVTEPDAWYKPAFRVSTMSAAPWPWLTSSAALDGEQLWPLENASTNPSGHDEELERALTAAQVKADVRPLPPPAERRRDAVQRFIAAPVVDLGMVREERAREQSQAVPAGKPERSAAKRDPKAAERNRGAGRGRRESPDPDRSGAANVRWIPGSTPLSGVNPGTHLTGSGQDSGGGQDFRGGQDAGADSNSGGGDSRGGRGRGDGRRAKPRHAAPPASLGAALSRTLTGTRLTSRSAAHAG